MTPKVPSYRLHKSTGRAVVTLRIGNRRRDVYLGKHDTPESRQRYRQVIAEYLQGAVTAVMGRGAPGQEQPALTVSELTAAFLDHAERYYRKNGKLTSEYSCIRYAVTPLVQLYGRTPITEFGPRALKTVRAEMVQQGYYRNTVNAYVNRIRRMFKWGVENELVPAEAHHALSAVTGLRRGRTPAPESDPVRPVPEKDYEAVLPLVAPEVAAMARLQYWTGMRPGEVLQMRWGDIDRTGAVWVYRPRSHKTEHHGRAREIPLGPRAQEVLQGFLRLDSDQRIFSYTRDSYRRAITRACERAGVPSWSPNRLRHSAATRLRKELGLEAARVVLGHTSASVTEVYAEMDRERAHRAMVEHG